MSELAVGSLAGLAANSYVIDVASGSQLTQPGMVLQVVSTTKTDVFTTTSTSYTPITGLSASITPSATANKVLVRAVVQINPRASVAPKIVLKRGATQLAIGDAAGSRTRASAIAYDGTGNLTTTIIAEFLDSPSSTSSETYSVDVLTNSGTVGINTSIEDQDNSARGRSASTITLMEIAG